MERRAHRRGWLIAVFVALMANQAFAAASTRLFVCSGDRVARLECCCPQMTGAPSSEQVVVLEAPCCCQLTRAVSPAARTTTAGEARLPAKVFLAWLAPLALVALPAPPATLSSSRAQRPPPAPVTILQQKQSFLI